MQFPYRGHSGIVFSLTPPSAPGAAWTETVLYNFPGGTGWHAMTLSLGQAGYCTAPRTCVRPRRSREVRYSRSRRRRARATRGLEATVWQFPSIKEGATSDQRNGPLFIQPQTGALFGATGDPESPGVLFEMVPPSPGGGGWSRQVLPPKQGSFAPIVGVGAAGALYGTDAATNVVWSLTLQVDGSPPSISQVTNIAIGDRKRIPHWRPAPETSPAV